MVQAGGRRGHPTLYKKAWGPAKIIDTGNIK